MSEAPDVSPKKKQLSKKAAAPTEETVPAPAAALAKLAPVVKAKDPGDEFPLANIVLREKNVRSEYTKMAELSESISMEGIILPLVLASILDEAGQPTGKGELIAGYRRYFAAKKLGLKLVPVRFITADEPRRHRIALVENIQREEMNPLERALGIQQMMENEQLDQKNVAESLGVSEGYVSQHLALLKLPTKAQAAVRNGKIEMTHARALGRLKDEASVLELLPEASKITAAALNTKVEFRIQKDKEKAAKEDAKEAKKPDAKGKPTAKKSGSAAPAEAKSLAERYAEMELAPLNKTNLRERMMEVAIKLDRAESDAKRNEYKYTLKGLEIAAGLK